MNFASSSLGGLKRSDDGLSGFKKSLEASLDQAQALIWTPCYRSSIDLGREQCGLIMDFVFP